MKKRSLIDSLLGFLFPDRCVGCGKVGHIYCDACRAAVTMMPTPPRLPLLSSPQNAPHNQTMLREVRVAFVHSGSLRAAIHTLKYHRMQRIAPILSDMMAQALQQHHSQQLSAHTIDAVVPVPLHPNRLKERGFNQSELLAHGVAQQLRVPMLAHAIVRQRDTAHQVGLDATQRQHNITNAFVWNSSTSTIPRRVLLIDDVLTTGATLLACAAAMHHAGVHDVRAYTLAHSVAKKN